MPIAEAIKKSFASASLIRKMFEEGSQLKKQHGADKVFDFSLGNPDVDPPAAFHDVLLKLIQENVKGSHGYMSNAGFPEVREKLAKKVSAEQGVNSDASHIVMAAGAAGGLNVVLKTICDPGDEVIVSKPFFVEYRAYAANHGVKLVEVDSLADFNPDIAAIGAVLSDKTKAVLINSPNNPTGKIYPAQTLADITEILLAQGKKTERLPYLVSDEPYREIAYGVKVPSVLGAYSESIVVYSYSKSLSLPGERIGYIAVSPGISDKNDVIDGLIYSTRALGYVNAPALMQRAVAELTLEKVDVSVYARRRDAFMKVLDKAGIEYSIPEGAFYLFCKVPPGKNHEKADDFTFVDHLKKHLILGVPGASFGKPLWLRFAYCVDEKIIRASESAFMEAMKAW